MKKPRAQRKREKNAEKIGDLQGRIKELRSLANLAIERRDASESELNKCRFDLAGWEEWERRVNSMLPPMSALRREIGKIVIPKDANVIRFDIPAGMTLDAPESLADTQSLRAIDVVQQRQFTLHKLVCSAHLDEMTDALVVDAMIGGVGLKRFFTTQALISMPPDYAHKLICAEVVMGVKKALKGRMGGCNGD